MRMRGDWRTNPPAPVMMVFLPWRRPRGGVAAIVSVDVCDVMNEAESGNTSSIREWDKVGSIAGQVECII